MMKYIYYLVCFTFFSYGQRCLGQHSLKSYYLSPYKGGDLSKLSIGGNIGMNLFKNDLHGFFEAKGQNNFLNFHISGDLSYRFTNYISLRAGISGYQLSAMPTDKAASLVIFETKPAMYSNNLEGYVCIVHDIFSRYRIDRGQLLFNVYGMLGIGMTYFDPKNSITKESLRPAESDPNSYQDFAYANFMPIIPVGIGVSYCFSDNNYISFELAHRFSRTAWLDNAYHSYRVVDDNGITLPGAKERTVYDGYTFISFRYQHTFIRNNGRKYSYRKYKRQKGK